MNIISARPWGQRDSRTVVGEQHERSLSEAAPKLFTVVFAAMEGPRPLPVKKNVLKKPAAASAASMAPPVSKARAQAKATSRSAPRAKAAPKNKAGAPQAEAQPAPAPAHQQTPAASPLRLQTPIWYGSDCSGLDAAAFGLSNITGFKHWFCSEIAAQHRVIFKKLHPSCEHVYESAAAKDFDALRAERNRRPNNIFLYTAGFPCEPFAKQGLGRGSEDGRASCVWDILRTIHELRPTAYILENVPELLRRFPDHFNDIVNAAMKLAGRGYWVDYQTLDSRFYGNVPATRHRVYIVGVRKDCLARNWHWPGRLDAPGLRSFLITGIPKVDLKSLSSTSLKTLAAALKKLKQSGCDPMRDPWVVDLANSADYGSNAVHDQVPTVTKSHAHALWVTSVQRFLSLEELLLCQGIRREQLKCRVEDMNPRILARMIGNAFTATVLERLIGLSS